MYREIWDEGVKATVGMSGSVGQLLLNSARGGSCNMFDFVVYC
ncbi:hypothetical protein HanXRQr2_Chr02g0056391 [Helianthus annuus]|uniref:Uncharacterized protein n=1 Tax=Helianthus annuus TaxID=4232 RepID=A0A9K3JM64_HELAN|nr:hypothetical protein HanXRQr2_Chr02g0056391 [Helianthus annuus]KAJ0951082.1 hypothetical protein HanPSC8_Chr02g0055771 [Helianthus annuus]